MEFVIVALMAGGASLLTFFSGFGLGTILTPAFVWFFPVEVAIAMTGAVHLLNNLFKWMLIGNHARKEIVLKFGLPAMAGAFVGAYLLEMISGTQPLFEYQLGNKACQITEVKLLIALLMLAFALVEILPSLKKTSFGKQWLFPGGLVSGFFGGLSGHQGALRSMFLIRYTLPKEAFIATGIAIATLIDITRLSVYSQRFMEAEIMGQLPILITALLAAFVGAVIGKQALKKVTIGFVQSTVAILIVLMALLLGAGMV